MRRRLNTKGFSLAELLVAIGIIALLGSLTIVGVRGIAKDARMSSAVNTVSAVLDNARGMALRNNNVVLVVFRPRSISPQSMLVEAVLAEWTGESYPSANMGSPFVGVIDRFVAIQGVAPRQLPSGIKVAAPFYGLNEDETWLTQPHLPRIEQSNPVGGSNERQGALIGVMYGPDGTTLVRNPQSDSHRYWIDFDSNTTDAPLIRFLNQDYSPYSVDVTNDFFDQRLEDDESFVSIAPFLAVFDDEEAREQRTNEWTSQAGYEADLTGVNGYITRLGRRLHFNRYTGVVMSPKAQ